MSLHVCYCSCTRDRAISRGLFWGRQLEGGPFSQRLEGLAVREMPGEMGRGLGGWGRLRSGPCRGCFLPPAIRRALTSDPPPPPLMLSQSRGLSLGHMWNRPSTLAPSAKARDGPCPVLTWTEWKGSRGAWAGSLDVGRMSPWKPEKRPLGHSHTDFRRQV